MNVSAPQVGPRNIFFIHSSDDLYGSDVLLLELVRGLDKDRFVPWVLLPSDTRHIGKLSPELIRSGVAFRHIPYPVLRRRYFTPLGLLKFAHESITGLKLLRALAREHKAVLIHTNTLAVPIGAILARTLSIPHVWHIHEILVKPRFVRKLLHRMVARWSDVGVCISEAVRKHVAEDQPKANLVVVRNGIRPTDFSQVARGELRASLNLAPGTVLIGTIGRISAWKGQSVLAQAVGLLKHGTHSVHTVVVGGVFDGDLRALHALQQVIHEQVIENVFTIRDFHPDARVLLQDLDIFVLPSVLPEPFGLVVTEAMAAGLPVVATNHGGPKEVVLQNETGLLVPPNDADAMAAALLTLIASPELRKSFGDEGRRRMQTHFGLDRFIEQMSALYNELLS